MVLKKIHRIVFSRIVCSLLIFPAALKTRAFSLWSTADTWGATGEFIGPGIYTENQPLFEMVLKNLAFTNRSDFVVPFFNNADKLPNMCAEYDLDEHPDGQFSSGLKFNENADMCLANVAGTDMHIGVIRSGPLQGKIQFMVLNKKTLLVSMDIAFDLGIGEKGMVFMPFYGTTDRVQIPLSLQTQLNMPGGSDQAGRYKSGDWLQGRLGDADEDGLIDGTLVSVGNIPLESPVFPGQPYAMIRHFELDVPAAGYILGDVQSVQKRTVLSSAKEKVEQ